MEKEKDKASALKKGKGQRKAYNIKIGWQNFRNDKFRTVTKPKGGGNRIIRYPHGEDPSVNSILSKASEFFFPGGRNAQGCLNEFEVTLASSSGEEIQTFKDAEGNTCSFTEYLRTNKLFVSQCHLYLRTKLLPKQYFSIDGKIVESAIHLKYSKLHQSEHSDQLSEVNCHSFKSCYEVCDSAGTDINSFDPFEDGFLITKIEVNHESFLEREDNVYYFHNACSEEAKFVIHGPSVIHGLESDNSDFLLLGVVTFAHNQGFVYNWWANNTLVCSGIDHCVLRVKEAGEYMVSICNASAIVGQTDSVRVETFSSLTRLRVIALNLWQIPCYSHFSVYS